MIKYTLTNYKSFIYLYNKTVQNSSLPLQLATNTMATGTTTWPTKVLLKNFLYLHSLKVIGYNVIHHIEDDAVIKLTDPEKTTCFRQPGTQSAFVDNSDGTEKNATIELDNGICNTGSPNFATSDFE